MERWSKAVGGTLKPVFLRQGSNLLLFSWSDASKWLLVFSVDHMEYIPLSRSVTGYQGPGLD